MDSNFEQNDILDELGFQDPFTNIKHSKEDFNEQDFLQDEMMNEANYVSNNFCQN